MVYGCADFNSPPLIACPGFTTSALIHRRVAPRLTPSWGAHHHSVYSYAMKNKEALQIGEPAGAQAQGKAHPTRRILVVDGDMGSRQSSAERSEQRRVGKE